MLFDKLCPVDSSGDSITGKGLSDSELLVWSSVLYCARISVFLDSKFGQMIGQTPFSW